MSYCMFKFYILNIWLKYSRILLIQTSFIREPLKDELFLSPLKKSLHLEFSTYFQFLIPIF